MMAKSSTVAGRYLVEVNNAGAIDSLCQGLQDAGTVCAHKYYRVFSGFAAQVRPLGIAHTCNWTRLLFKGHVYVL